MGGHCRPWCCPTSSCLATFVIRSLIPGFPGPKELLNLPRSEEAGLVVSVFLQFLGWGAVYASCITGPSLNKSVLRSRGRALPTQIPLFSLPPEPLAASVSMLCDQGCNFTTPLLAA